MAHEVFGMPHTTESSNRASHDGLGAVGTDVLEQFEVVWIAVELAFVLVAIASTELASTLLASIMFWMHTLSVDSDVLTNDGLLTLATNACRWFDLDRTCCLACETVWLAFVLLVRLPSKLSATSSTEEVLGMVHLAYGIDALVGDGLQARRTLGTKQLIEVIIAVSLPLLLHKVASFEWLSTLCT